MKTKVICSGIIFFLVALSGELIAQATLDSLIIKRANAFNGYRQTEDSLKAPTRNNLSIIVHKAGNLIKLDSALINDYLFKEIENNKLLAAKIEQLTLEVTLLQKEAELNKMMTEERGYIMRVLLYGMGIVSLLFIIALILFIDRQIRFRSIKLELERTWPLRGENRPSETDHTEQRELQRKFEELNTKNEELARQVNDLTIKIREKEEVLNKEINSKQQIEDEIRKLISQIKQG